VTYEESYLTERPEYRDEEGPWLMIMPCRHGHIYPWGGDPNIVRMERADLRESVRRPRRQRKRLALPVFVATNPRIKTGDVPLGEAWHDALEITR